MATVPGEDMGAGRPVGPRIPGRVRSLELQPESQRFTELYRSHHQKVYAYACRRVGPEMAAEIVSETFLVAWRKVSEVPASPLPWLYKVASFEIANHRRRLERAEQLNLALAVSQRGAPPSVTSAGVSDHIARAFESLSPDDQEILRLAAWERVSSVEGAAVLGCSVSAYRMRLHRARHRLGRRVGELRAGVWREADARGPETGVSEPQGLRVQGAEIAI